MKHGIFVGLSIAHLLWFPNVLKAEVAHKIIINPVNETDRRQLEETAAKELKSLEAKNNSNPKDLVERARLAYWAGHFSENSSQKAKFFEIGMKLMEPLLTDSKDPYPVLLWAANAGGISSIKRNLDALRMLEEIEVKLLEVSSKFPDFQSGAADRALAGIYLSAPPFLSIGSGKKAKKHAEAAYQRDAHHPGNILVLAKILERDGEEGRAKKLLEEVLTLAVPEKYPYDYAAWRTEALEELDSSKGYEIVR